MIMDCDYIVEGVTIRNIKELHIECGSEGNQISILHFEHKTRPGHGGFAMDLFQQRWGNCVPAWLDFGYVIVVHSVSGCHKILNNGLVCIFETKEFLSLFSLVRIGVLLT